MSVNPQTLMGRYGRQAVLLCAVAVVATLPWLGASGSTMRRVLLVAVFALVVSGINLSFGYAGELALGHAAMFAAGAYATAIFARSVSSDLVLTIPLAAAVAVVVGLASSAPGLRLKGWALAITSFFLILLIPDVLTIFREQTGGFAGLPGIPRPQLLGAELGQDAFFTVAVLLTAAWLAVFRNFVLSRNGEMLKVLRQSPVLTSSLGVSVYRLKLKTFALSSVPAGIAGTLFAHLDGYISPVAFNFDVAIGIFAASILGGAATIYGAIVGAAIIQLGPLQSAAFEEYSLIVFGLMLLIGGVFLSGGLAGIAEPARRRIARLAGRRPEPESLGPPRGAAYEESRQRHAQDVTQDTSGSTLTVTGLSKRFGGLQALDDVTLEAQPGEITALIGPNGSGKTTLLNIISGFYKPDSGIAEMDGIRLTDLPPHRVGASGVARTFQTPIVPLGMDAETVVITAMFAGRRSWLTSAVLRTRQFRHLSAKDRDKARTALGLVGLGERSHEAAASLPLGIRRLLEMARAVGADPRVILLDEVASGLDDPDVERLADLIRDLKRAGATIVLVEHNFRLVLDLADHIYVLAEGRVVAEGSAKEIAEDPVVHELYLGRTASEPAQVAKVKDEP